MSTPTVQSSTQPTSVASAPPQSRRARPPSSGFRECLKHDVGKRLPATTPEKLAGRKATAADALDGDKPRGRDRGARAHHPGEGAPRASAPPSTTATTPTSACEPRETSPAGAGGRAPRADEAASRSAHDRRPALRERDEGTRAPDGVAFTPLPTVLLPPSVAVAATPVSPRTAPAEIAAMADRLLRSLRVGRLADGTSMVRLQLDGGGRGDVHVELRQTEAGIAAVVSSTDGDRARAAEWADRLSAELGARGLDLRSIELG
jgi:hypothetical protein